MMIIDIRAWSLGNRDQITDLEFPSRFQRWRDACLSVIPVASMLLDPHQLELLQKMDALDIAQDAEKNTFRWLAGTEVQVIMNEDDKPGINPTFVKQRDKTEEEKKEELQEAIDPLLKEFIDKRVAAALAK